MSKPNSKQEHQPEEIDLTSPWFQDAPVSRDILDLLRGLADRFRSLPPETTDADWAAFSALAKAGAAEGIIRVTCMYADADGPCTEYFLVRGDYAPDMPTRPILKTEPFESVLVQARLTATGVRWAEYLAAEKSQPAAKARGVVLQLLWDAEPVQGNVHRVPPPSAAEALEVTPIRQPREEQAAQPNTRSQPAQTDEGDDEQGHPPDDELQFGLPAEDPYDSRVVNWLGKRLYLGRDTQVSRLFWLLARRPGVPHDLGDVQQAVDGVWMDLGEAGDAEFRKTMNRIAKALSKLRMHLRENNLDDHVLIVKEGPSDGPSYTMISRFGTR
ncbi:MAG: hypothetical protein JXQ73_03670 [Phycisphaerae bacterium]|nr:hypothetical protein [Phycisphaerae bacterium]